MTMKFHHLISIIGFLLCNALSVWAKDEPPSDSRQIVSLGNDALSTMSQSQRQQLALQTINANFKNKDGIAIISLPESKLAELSEYMHKNHRRCGGYIWHNSLQQASDYVSKVHRHKQSNSVVVDYTIDNEATVNAMLTQIVSSNMASTVNAMGSYNNRYYSASSGVEASQWLKSYWEGLTSTRDDMSVELYQHDEWDQPSVIVTIEGDALADEVVVIGGHLDSINGQSANRETARAPGHDDNASGIAVITETLRAMVTSGYKPSRTVKIMGYAAEEVGLRGSGEIAADYRTNGIDVVGVAQFDMTGYKGTANTDIFFMTDYTNAEQNQFMIDLLEHYFSDINYGTDRCGYGCSDHASWHNEGFAASMPFESAFNDYNSDIHTAGDNHFDTEHATNFLKLAIAYVGEMAKGVVDADNYESRSTLQFRDGSAELEEGQTLSVVIQRQGLIDETASVNYQTIDGTATAGSDYEAASGTLSWDVNDGTDKTIEISALDLSEDKTFTIELSQVAGNGELGDRKVMLIQLVNNSISSVSFDQASVEIDEASTTTIRVQRSGDLDQVASVAYQAVNGTAIAGTDYEAVSGLLNWEVGNNDDKVIELKTFAVSEDKTFSIDLRNATGNAQPGEIMEVAVLIVDKSTAVEPEPDPEPENNSSSGGSMNWILLLPFVLGLLRRR